MPRGTSTRSLMVLALVVVMAVAVATGRDTTGTQVLHRLVVRFGPALRVALPSLIALPGLVLAVDVATYLATGGTHLLH